MQYMCSVSGTATLNVTVGGAPIGGAPLTVRVLPSPVFAAECRVENLVSEWVVGEWLVLKLSLRDRLGNPRETGSNKVVLRLVRLAESGQAWREGSVLVVTNAAGQEPDARNDDERASAAAGMHSDDSSRQCKTLADYAAHAASLAVEDAVDGSLGGEGGCEGGCEGGQPLQTRTELNTGCVGSPHFQLSEVLAVDRNDGTVELRALVHRAGLYAVRIFVDGMPVPLPHSRIDFLPAPVDARRCELGGDVGSGEIVTNRFAPLFVTLRDRFGNSAYQSSWGDAPPRIHLTLNLGAAHFLAPQLVARNRVPLPEAHFEARVKALVPGPLEIGVHVDGCLVRGKPLMVFAHAGTTVGRQCFCSGSGWAKLVPAGAKLAFTVHSCDGAGHAQTRGADTFVVELAPRAHGHHFRGKPRQLKGRRVNTSQTVFEMGSLSRGPYVLTVRMRGTHVRGSPLHFEAEEPNTGKPPKPRIARSSLNRNAVIPRGQGY